MAGMCSWRMGSSRPCRGPPSPHAHNISCVQLAGSLGPFPSEMSQYEPINSFMGSRVFPSGASIDSLSAYQMADDRPTGL